MNLEQLAIELKRKQGRYHDREILDRMDDEDMVWAYLTCPECEIRFLDSFSGLVEGVGCVDEFTTVCNMHLALHRAEGHGDEIVDGHGEMVDLGGLRRSCEEYSPTSESVLRACQTEEFVEGWVYSQDSSVPLTRFGRDDWVRSAAAGAKMARTDWLTALLFKAASGLQVRIYVCGAGVITALPRYVDVFNEVRRSWKSKNKHPYESIKFWRRVYLRCRRGD